MMEKFKGHRNELARRAIEDLKLHIAHPESARRRFPPSLEEDIEEVSEAVLNTTAGIEWMADEWNLPRDHQELREDPGGE